MAKMMAPNTRIDFIPDGGVADPLKPTAAELNAGTNLSPAITTGFTLGFTDSDTDDSKSIVDEANVATPTRDNYEANLTFFMAPESEDSADPVEIAYQEAEALFGGDQHVEGWLVLRIGYKADVDYAADQEVSLFRVISDIRRISSEDNAPIMMEVPFLAQGQGVNNVPVVAGGGGGGG